MKHVRFLPLHLRQRVFSVSAAIPWPNVNYPPQVIPYTGPIPGGLQPGEIIIIQGTVPPDADR